MLIGFEHLDATAGFAQLHDRAFRHEQVHETDGFGEVAAAVFAQVEHHAVDAAFGLEFVDQLAHVTRGAAVFLVAGRARVVVLVEGRHGDHADLEFLVAALDLADLFLRRLRFERDLAAGQREHVLLRAGRCIARLDLQAHERAVRSADQLHDVVETPADDVHHLAGLALADREDAIVGLAARRSAARNRRAGSP